MAAGTRNTLFATIRVVPRVFFRSGTAIFPIQRFEPTRPVLNFKAFRRLPQPPCQVLTGRTFTPWRASQQSLTRQNDCQERSVSIINATPALPAPDSKVEQAAQRQSNPPQAQERWVVCVWHGRHDLQGIKAKSPARQLPRDHGRSSEQNPRLKRPLHHSPPHLQEPTRDQGAFPEQSAGHAAVPHPQPTDPAGRRALSRCPPSH